jgi:Arc/MetJ-type ribon-helix-helix transcriptional regulator
MTRRERITVSISADLIKWMDQKVDDHTFGSRSHGVEKALAKLKEKEP